MNDFSDQQCALQLPIIFSLLPPLFSTSFHVPLFSTEMIPQEKSSKSLFPLRSLKKTNQTLSISSSFLPSYQEQVFFLSFNLSFSRFINPGCISNTNFKREYSIIWICHLLPSRYIALNHKHWKKIYKFICFAVHKVDPTEILNYAEVKSGVNKASLDKPENLCISFKLWATRHVSLEMCRTGVETGKRVGWL